MHVRRHKRNVAIRRSIDVDPVIAADAESETQSEAGQTRISLWMADGAPIDMSSCPPPPPPPLLQVDRAIMRMWVTMKRKKYSQHRRGSFNCESVVPRPVKEGRRPLDLDRPSLSLCHAHVQVAASLTI